MRSFLCSRRCAPSRKSRTGCSTCAIATRSARRARAVDAVGRARIDGDGRGDRRSPRTRPTSCARSSTGRCTSARRCSTAAAWAPASAAASSTTCSLPSRRVDGCGPGLRRRSSLNGSAIVSRLDRWEFTVAPEAAGERLDAWLARQGLPWSRSQLTRRIEEGEVTVGGTRGAHAVAQGARARARGADGGAARRRRGSARGHPARRVVRGSRTSSSSTSRRAWSCTRRRRTRPARWSTRSCTTAAIRSSASAASGGRASCTGSTRTPRASWSWPRTSRRWSALQAQFHAHDHRAHLPRARRRRGRRARLVQDEVRARSARSQEVLVGGGVGQARGHALARASSGCPGASFVEVSLETGRTHQIRVHFSDHGHPLVGDRTYGRPPREPRLRAVAKALGRQALHAHVLGITHPATGARMRWSTPPPPDMQAALAALRG